MNATFLKEDELNIFQETVICAMTGLALHLHVCRWTEMFSCIFKLY
jgi:hypothetical protein